MEQALIIAEAGDIHALAVGARLKCIYGVEAMIWDSSRFPAEDSLNFELDRNGHTHVHLDTDAIGAVDLENFTAIWWRRPARPRIPSDAGPDHMKEYCRRESKHLFRGALEAVNVPIYNPPSLEQRAERKPFQLTCAAQCGLRLPRTLITNCEDKVREFYNDLDGHIIMKPFSAPPGTFFGTQRVTKPALEGLCLLKNAPVVFQEKIPAGRDIRACVVEDKIFSAEIATSVLDWRMDATVVWKHHELPAAIKLRIRRFMRRMGLTLGSLDLRLYEEEYYFLEVNPNGQFLFLEVDDASLEISSEIARLLSRRARRARETMAPVLP